MRHRDGLTAIAAAIVSGAVAIVLTVEIVTIEIALITVVVRGWFQIGQTARDRSQGQVVVVLTFDVLALVGRFCDGLPVRSVSLGSGAENGSWGERD